MITAREGIEKYSDAGITKAKMPKGRMFILAVLAGLFISLVGIASTIASSMVGNASLAKLITALIFPAGLALVVINGAELFTGNNLMIISVLDKKIKISQMLRNWVIVYIGNFTGSIIGTGMFTLGHEVSMFDNAFAQSAVATAVTKCNLSFGDAFLRAILCNVLVCVAVMMSMLSSNLMGKIVGLFLPIMVFVLSGFEHSVANMSYISGGLFLNMAYGDIGVATEGLSWFNFLVSNMIPVTLGNIVGGCLMGLAYWYTARTDKQLSE